MLRHLLKSIWLVFLFCLVAFTAEADVINQREIFFIDKQYDFQGRTQISATMRYSSNQAYAYVEDSFWNSLNSPGRQSVLESITRILTEFDARIYPIETKIFGPEPNPGIDKDPRITILFTPLVENAGGYINTSDCFARTDNNKTSNQREMFYLNVGLIANEKKMESYLAHEFQHLISFNQKEFLRGVAEDTWLNETRSEYAVSLLGYNDVFSGSSIEKRLQTFLANPSDSLTEWKNLAPDYGQIALFSEYLTEHWSGNSLTDTLKTDAAGIPSINVTLLKNNVSENFASIFRHWMIANILNDTKTNSKYGYLRTELRNFRVTPTKTLHNIGDETVFAVSNSIKDWQANWYDISGFSPGQNPVLKIFFSSPSLTSFQISYLLFRDDGTVENKIFEPSLANESLFINGVNAGISQVILMPFKKDKLSNFSANESPVVLSFMITREKNIPEDKIAQLEFLGAKPSDYGLKEGDFIRADGDIDVFIINDFGYKRLILNPAICLMYGHLGDRGCFSAVKTVSPAVRDAFKTSWYFTNGEMQDGKVYKLQPTGDDTATLHHLNISGADFINQDGDFRSVFLINSKEQSSFQTGIPFTRI